MHGDTEKAEALTAELVAIAANPPPPEPKQPKKPKRDQHGLRAVRNALSRGKIDNRCRVARLVNEWKASLVRDLGGEDQLSAQKMALIEVVCRTRLMLESVDFWLLEQPSLVQKKKRQLLPVVSERTRLADSLTRTLSQLGLERVPQDATSLAEYLKTKAKTTGSE
jgi:hypothetical protein